MFARWSDGRELCWASSEPFLVGSPEVVADARVWLATRRGGVCAVTPTGPFVDAVESERLAVFAAVSAVAPGASWEGAPDLLAGVPGDAVL